MSNAAQNELEAKVLAHIAKISGRSESELERGQHLMADLAIDSPKALQLMMDLEEILGIEIPDEEAERFQRVGDLLDYVTARSSA